MESLIATFISILFGLAFCKTVEGIYGLRVDGNLDWKMWALFFAFALNLIQAYLSLLRCSENDTARRIYRKGWGNAFALFIGCFIWAAYSFIALSLRDFNKPGNFPDYMNKFLLLTIFITFLYFSWDFISLLKIRHLGKDAFKKATWRWLILEIIGLACFSAFYPYSKGYLNEQIGFRPKLSFLGIISICVILSGVDFFLNSDFLFTGKEQKE